MTMPLGSNFSPAPPVRLAWIGEAWTAVLGQKRRLAGCVGVSCRNGFFALRPSSPCCSRPMTIRRPRPARASGPDFWQFLLGWDVLAGLSYLGVSALLSGGAYRMAVRQVRGESIGFRDLFRSRREISVRSRLCADEWIADFSWAGWPACCRAGL